MNERLFGIIPFACKENGTIKMRTKLNVIIIVQWTKSQFYYHLTICINQKITMIFGITPFGHRDSRLTQFQKSVEASGQPTVINIKITYLLYDNDQTNKLLSIFRCKYFVRKISLVCSTFVAYCDEYIYYYRMKVW